MEYPISIKEKTVGSSVIEESLLSMEELDRASPELWPEQIPGESEYYASTTSFGKGQTWMKGLDNDDKAFLIYLSKLTPTGLVSEVKKLYDSAYQLGCEESKEMTRGKYLKNKPKIKYRVDLFKIDWKQVDFISKESSGCFTKSKYEKVGRGNDLFGRKK